MLTQCIQQADTRLNPQLMRLAVDVQRDRPGQSSRSCGAALTWLSIRPPPYVSGAFTWRMSK